jgi:carboxylesterase
MTLDDSLFDCSETHDGCQALRRDSVKWGVADPDDLPFMYSPPGAQTAVLLVHGFTATPWEMRPLGRYLADAGLASLAVCLPGHGTSPEDLARCRWQDWLGTLVDGHQLLTREFPAVYGMGMSTGNLLLLTMVRSHPLRGLVLFSPYLRVKHRLAPFAGWLRWVHPYQYKPVEEGLNKRYYDRRPLSGIHQINLLLQGVRRQLAHIGCPVLAFNGEDDQTVDIATGRQLVERLGSSFKIHAQYGPNVPHVLTGTDNPYRLAMFYQATRFIQGLEDPEAALQTR